MIQFINLSFVVNRKYLMDLKLQGLLQNFYLEAGIVMPGLQVMEDPEHAELHWGWEAPTCQLRGHFTGHWIAQGAGEYWVPPSYAGTVFV